MDLAELLNDHNVVVMGLITVFVILIAVLFEKYMPLEPEMPKIV